MSDGVLFAVLFLGFFVLRIIAATVFFLYILPTGIQCPNCNADTVRVQSRGWNLLMPWFRTSWCYECGWDGLLRKGPVETYSPIANNLSQPGQLPLSSKKSSK
ncbi:MAG TPA: hypothetical protein VHM30_16355 [Gemmatimonadaceae bacterium]|nr:hypothetical protein [Gemmatimonadaceae bacterium]